MFENLYTTKMSMDKKKLQNRFSKIISKNGRLSRLWAVMIFAVIVAVIAAVSVYIATTQINEYTMNEEDFKEYTSRPVGSIMAEIDYADDEKLVFHYLEGFFIADMQSYDIKHKIDLRKLNIPQHSQGDSILRVAISNDGKYAYLTSEGTHKDNFDDYIISLDSGEVKIGEMPEDTEIFTDYAPINTIPTLDGWFTNRCVKLEGRSCYLIARTANIGDIELITVHHAANNNTGRRFVFGEDYVSDTAKKMRIVYNSLEEGEEIIVNSGASWNVDARIVRQIINKLSEIMNMKKIDVKDGAYQVLLYATELKGNGAERIFIFNQEDFELIFSVRLDATGYGGMKEYTGELLEILEAERKKSEKYAEKEAEAKETLVQEFLPEGDTIAKESRRIWTVDDLGAKEIYDIVGKYMSLRKVEFKKDSYDIFLCDIEGGEDSMKGLFIIDNSSYEILFHLSGSNLDENILPEVISFLEFKYSDNMGGERARFYDSKGNQIFPDANWYKVGLKATAIINTAEDCKITAYYTDSGTDMEQYKKVVGKGKSKNGIANIELTFEEDVHGHLWFVTEKGKNQVQSEIYCVTSDKENLLNRTYVYLEEKFHRVYDPYYDIQSLAISNWEQKGDEATFFFNMRYLSYNRDPDKAEYIQEAKKGNKERYEALYKDYLALKDASYHFKVVSNGKNLEIYTDVSPKGEEWEPIDSGDWLLNEKNN